MMNTQLNESNFEVEEIIQLLIETLSKILTLDFLKECVPEESKVFFYSVWNLAYEAKER